MVVKVNRGHTGRQDIDHPHCDDAPVQPVLLVKGAVTHLGPIRRVLCLGGRETVSENGHCSKQ